ncbi:hypothetical protein BB050_02857 [Flavobacterium anhuiense]|uniref:Uncharacterized protein n=1 Tax=Flavobacterium anhuiense TaxID=459526 RepID=A0AAC9D3D4_9FLAO|nr:three component ABC system middle component [Flavobacterium anhuiense]AOC95951.1 hypothetical protein BB050_02857 [Flavobacterium anhuiense]
MKSKELEQLIFNPFYTTRILHHFLSGVKSKTKNGIKTELINIVLPIIYNEILVKILCRLNVKSSFKSLISTNEFKIFSTQINQEIRNFRAVTNNSLILLANDSDLVIGEFTNINIPLSYHDEIDSSLKLIYKSSYNLGMIMSKEKYQSIFLKLKITEL